MKYLVSLFLLINGLIFGMHKELPDAIVTKPATIKVLLKKNVPGTLLEVKGSYSVINPLNKKKLSSGMMGKRYYLYPHKNGLKWGEDFPGIYQIQVLPKSTNTTVLIDGIQYKGSVGVYIIDDALCIINEVTVEDYLKSILTHKIKEKHSQSVLDAIAIVARTDTYYAALLNHDAHWHVDAQEVNYKGYGLNQLNPDIDKSVDNTRYLIMTYDEQPFASTWSDNCSGKTAAYHKIFRKNTATPSGVISRFAKKDRDDFSWSYTMGIGALASIAKVNRVTGIDLFVDDKSEKVYALRIHDGVHTEDLDFLQLQKKIGEEKILSNDLTVSLKGANVHFSGYGKGLGIGLCLYSAEKMVQRGDSAPDILSEFYPNTHVEKMRSYPEMVICPSNEYFITPKRQKTRGAKQSTN